MRIRSAALAAGLALGLMSGTAKAATISETYNGGSTATFVVTISGIYNIAAYGAQGGTTFQSAGGKGALISGNFNLEQGDSLLFKVALAGFGAANVLAGGGGGGGTFVVLTDTMSKTMPLLIAGGGAGGYYRFPGGPGQAMESGQDGRQAGAGAGGTDGKGGTGGQNYGSGGGGGFKSNGGDALSGAQGGSSFENGLAGGAGFGGFRGGFGGGGGGGYAAGGGGGGYSGGGGAGDGVGGVDQTGAGNGGGGGSYANADYLVSDFFQQAGLKNGDGYATIELVSAAVSAVPLPASAPMFGAALLGLAGLGYAAKRKKVAAAA